MSRPSGTESSRSAQSHQQPPNAPVDLSDSESIIEPIDFSMIRPIDPEIRRAREPDEARPGDEDSGSEYSQDEDEQFVATQLANFSVPRLDAGNDLSGNRDRVVSAASGLTPILTTSSSADEQSVVTPRARSSVPRQEYSVPGPYAEGNLSEVNDSGIGLTPVSTMSAAGPSTATSLHSSTGQARAGGKNHGLGDPRGSPRHLERFPDLGPEPVALMEVSNRLRVLAAEQDDGGTPLESDAKETDAIQENETAPARGTSILERTESLLRRNHIPRHPSTETNSPNVSTETQSAPYFPAWAQEMRRVSISDEEISQAIELNFHIARSTSTVNSQSTEACPVPGLKLNSNRLRPNSLSSDLPSSTRNGRPVPEITSTGNGRAVPDSTSNLQQTSSKPKSKRSILIPKGKGNEEEQLRAKGYEIEDTVQAFKNIEGRSKQERDLILEGHFDKIFHLRKPPSQYLEAERTVQIQEPKTGQRKVYTAEADETGDTKGSSTLKRIGERLKSVKKTIREMGEKRGRAMTREGSKRGRDRDMSREHRLD